MTRKTVLGHTDPPDPQSETPSLPCPSQCTSCPTSNEGYDKRYVVVDLGQQLWGKAGVE